MLIIYTLGTNDNQSMINLTNSKKLHQTPDYHKSYIYRSILEDLNFSYNFLIMY